jgi:DNA-binding transcriptional ArsR family regulator
MDQRPGAPTKGGDNQEIASILGAPRQRRILSLLLGRSQPITVRELGFQLAAYEVGIQSSDVTEVDLQSVLIDLEHRCLPQLEAVGWIERDQEQVIAVEPFSVETTLSLPDFQTPDDPDWEVVSVLLARPVRQEIVSFLAAHDDRVTVDELADVLRSRTRIFGSTDSSEEQQLLVRLHHIDLPKLADIDLVVYDSEENTVARTRRAVAVVRRIGLDTAADNSAFE